jgi:hypothetical protein
VAKRREMTYNPPWTVWNEERDQEALVSLSYALGSDYEAGRGERGRNEPAVSSATQPSRRLSAW